MLAVHLVQPSHSCHHLKYCWTPFSDILLPKEMEKCSLRS